MNLFEVECGGEPMLMTASEISNDLTLGNRAYQVLWMLPFQGHEDETWEQMRSRDWQPPTFRPGEAAQLIALASDARSSEWKTPLDRLLASCMSGRMLDYVVDGGGR